LALTLQPELAYVSGELRRGISVVVDEGGTIESVGTRAAGEVVRLPRRMLVPGLVSAHSHAFQRLLRGRTQWRAAGRDDFWAWRQRMYELAQRLTPEALEESCALTFIEMLRVGITAVGEFHYLHRDPDGHAYANPNELSLRVISAAERVGMRIVLLRSAYERAGPGQVLTAAQRRFGSGSLDCFLRDTEALARAVRDRPLVTVGVAPHSVRALDRSQLKELALTAGPSGWPIHMHLSEQPFEVEACVAETGLRPVELVADVGLLTQRFCAVHAIHLDAGEISLLGAARATVCACPTTERDLGDGVVPADALLRAGAKLALGSDSNTQIDLLEEARSLELNLRLLRRERVLMELAEDDRSALSRTLFEAATTGGAISLGLAPARLEEGGRADLVGFDLNDPSLAGADEDLLPRLIFGGQSRAARDVMVNGRFVVREGLHAQEEDVAERFTKIATSLLG
jgi:formimidoylglutamate deiminase